MTFALNDAKQAAIITGWTGVDDRTKAKIAAVIQGVLNENLRYCKEFSCNDMKKKVRDNVKDLNLKFDDGRKVRTCSELSEYTYKSKFHPAKLENAWKAVYGFNAAADKGIFERKFLQGQGTTYKKNEGKMNAGEAYCDDEQGGCYGHVYSYERAQMRKALVPKNPVHDFTISDRITKGYKSENGSASSRRNKQVSGGFNPPYHLNYQKEPLVSHLRHNENPDSQLLEVYRFFKSRIDSVMHVNEGFRNPAPQVETSKPAAAPTTRDPKMAKLEKQIADMHKELKGLKSEARARSSATLASVTAKVEASVTTPKACIVEMLAKHKDSMGDEKKVAAKKTTVVRVKKPTTEEDVQRPYDPKNKTCWTGKQCGLWLKLRGHKVSKYGASWKQDKVHELMTQEGGPPEMTKQKVMRCLYHVSCVLYFPLSPAL